MKIALMVITDGRECFHHTMDSVEDNFDEFNYNVIVDDSVNGSFQDYLEFVYGSGGFWGSFKIDHATEKRGFAEAIRAGWSHIPEDADYVFHMEDDFLFLNKPPLLEMIQTLEDNPHLVQMALLRGPVNEAEIAAGGLMQVDPDSYEHNGKWIEHRKFFTTNPCIYRRSIIERGWPDCANSEGIFGIELFASDPNLRSAFWGDGEQWVEHIGVRQGTGY